MGIFSSLTKKQSTDKNIAFEFTKEELSLIKTIPQGDKFNEIMRNKNLHEHTSTYIQGITMYVASAKNYPLAEKLAAFAESKAQNPTEQHFCYNIWIDLLYKQRDVPEKLTQCIEYCKKDIELYPEFDKDNRLRHGDNDILHIPSFERLAIIYEKAGDIENAIRINELALQYKNILKHESYQKRLEKLRPRIN